jgi:KamA family protein
VRYLTSLEDLPQLSADERERLRPVVERYAFRVNDYYVSLIDWSDPADPIRQLIIPRAEELDGWGRLDASNEGRYTVAHGCQHKYPDTALLLCNEVCGAYCRYCFRKRLFMNDNDEVQVDVRPGLDYIAQHPEITNVLLTGGDPLLLSTRRLAEILGRLREIPHVRIIRIGSKMPAFNPWRVLDDPDLLAALQHASRRHGRVYVMAHFDHPRELTSAAVEGLDALLRHGVALVNQCPLIAGVNDDPATLRKLWRRLSFVGCPPYYLFQGRPTAGNSPYKIPLVEGYRMYLEAMKGLSGLAARARFAMSHETGKIEVVGVDAERIYLRYHRAARAEDRGRFMSFRRDDEACWLDELEPA